MINQRKQQLTIEANTRRAALESLRSQLAGATARFRHTRQDAHGREVSELAGRVRLAEIALDGTIEELRRADAPEPVAMTGGSRESLLEDRRQIVQARDFRRATYAEAVEQESQRCGYSNPVHIANHIRNVFGGAGERLRRKQDEQDERRIRQIDAQLAVLDRRESPSPSPEAA